MEAFKYDQKINEMKVTYYYTYIVAFTCNIPNKKDVKTKDQRDEKER